MKKFYFLVACASLMVMGANAQTAEELYKAGKAEFEKYDKLYGEYVLAHQQKEDAPDATATERATALMKGFELLQKALPLDTVIEKNKDGSVKMDKKTGKPKFKTKYSKDIVPLLTSHINDVVGVGNSGIQAQDFPMAFKAFNYYRTLVNAPFAASLKPDPEMVSEIAFFEGYSAYFMKDYDAAYSAFKSALNGGYTQNGDLKVSDFMNDCVAQKVNSFCNDNKFAEANQYIDNIIAGDPSNGFLQNAKGFVVEMKDGFEAAEPVYKKATELDPKNADAFFNYGRVIYEKAVKIANDNSSKTNKELAPIISPLFREAKPLFEKAKALDEKNESKYTRYIEDIDYKLDMLK